MSFFAHLLHRINNEQYAQRIQMLAVHPDDILEIRNEGLATQ